MARFTEILGRVRWPSGVVATLHASGNWTIEGDSHEASAARVLIDELEYPGPAYGYPHAWALSELARRVPGGTAEFEIPENKGGEGDTD